MNFERRKDPFGVLGIGKRQLIKDWLDEMGVERYTINADYTIHVDSHVDLEHKGLTELPDYIKFNIITSYFDCSHNKLTSLRGCPNRVGGWFVCSLNLLTSLEHCPKYVRNTFWCQSNKVKFTKEDVIKLCDVRSTNIYV
jgi:hypothetical protein